MTPGIKNMSPYLLLGALCFALPASAQIEDSDEAAAMDDNAAAAVVKYYIPSTRGKAVAETFSDTTAEANKVVNSNMAAEAFTVPGGFNEARQKVRTVRSDVRRRGRNNFSSVAEKNVELPQEIDPMPFADGSQCENVSLRYRFKKSRFFVYPPVASDVGEDVANRRAKIACNCGKQIRPELPCYNGSIRRLTGEMVLITP